MHKGIKVFIFKYTHMYFIVSAKSLFCIVALSYIIHKDIFCNCFSSVGLSLHQLLTQISGNMCSVSLHSYMVS